MLLLKLIAVVVAIMVFRYLASAQTKLRAATRHAISARQFEAARDSRQIVLKKHIAEKYRQPSADIEKLVIESSASELARHIHARKVTSRDAVLVYAARCIAIGTDKDGINAITQEFYDEALEAAEEVDVCFRVFCCQSTPSLMNVEFSFCSVLSLRVVLI